MFSFFVPGFRVHAANPILDSPSAVARFALANSRGGIQTFDLLSCAATHNLMESAIAVR